jgi:hypothetical protein
MNPEKVFAYNKYLGALSPDEPKVKQKEDIHFISRRSNDTTTRRFSPDPFNYILSGNN